MKRLTDSFSHALEGIINTARVEKNLKIHFIVMVCVIIVGLIVKLTVSEWIICTVLFGLVISAEMFNTALEKTLDYVNEDYDKKNQIHQGCISRSCFSPSHSIHSYWINYFSSKITLIFSRTLKISSKQALYISKVPPTGSLISYGYSFAYSLIV